MIHVPEKQKAKAKTKATTKYVYTIEQNDFLIENEIYVSSVDGIQVIILSSLYPYLFKAFIKK